MIMADCFKSEPLVQSDIAPVALSVNADSYRREHRSRKIATSITFTRKEKQVKETPRPLANSITIKVAEDARSTVNMNQAWTPTVWILRSPRRAVERIFFAPSLVKRDKLWRKLKKEIFDPYRPELHYMRGPGPKTYEKRFSTQ
jgi:hypothetical protein